MNSCGPLAPNTYSSLQGRLANSENPAPFLRDNLLIQTNVIDAAIETDVPNCCFSGQVAFIPATLHSL